MRPGAAMDHTKKRPAFGQRRRRLRRERGAGMHAACQLAGARHMDGWCATNGLANNLGRRVSTRQVPFPTEAVANPYTAMLFICCFA